MESDFIKPGAVLRFPRPERGDDGLRFVGEVGPELVLFDRYGTRCNSVLNSKLFVADMAAEFGYTLVTPAPERD